MNKNFKKSGTAVIMAASLGLNAFMFETIKSSNETINSLDKKVTEINNKLDKKEKELSLEKDKNKQLEDSIEKAGLSPRQIEEASEVDMTMTFYGGGAEENGGYAGITAYGDNLVDGIVASNVHPRGTKFYDKKTGKMYIVEDKGGSNFNSYNRLDVFVPRYDGESKEEYNDRISNMGRQTKDMLKIDPI